MNFLQLLLLTTITILLLNIHIHSVHANPLTSADAAKGVEGNVNELNELNEMLTKPIDTNKKPVEKVEKPSKESSSFSHHDEDLPRSETNLELEESLKYDVEILESRDIKKENIEVEERFKGPSIQMNTDNFFAENIEVHGGDGDDAIQQSHMILSIILVAVALVSIGLYVALVIWRSQLEQRYGMRELLVTSDDDFCPQNYCNNDRSNNNNNLNNVYNETVNSNTRQFSLGHS